MSVEKGPTDKKQTKQSILRFGPSPFSDRHVSNNNDDQIFGYLSKILHYLLFII